jgi:hypothetical protein
MLRQTYTQAKNLKKSDWKTLEKFFSMIAPEQCAFVCMNWDTVIEEGLERALTVKNFDYGCDAKFTRFSKSSLTPVELEAETAIQVLKVHGSANWLYCDTCRTTFWVSPKETLRVAQELFRETDWRIVKKHIGENYKYGRHNLRKCPSCRARSLGTRFATFSYRKALDFPMYERSWLTIERLLREAKTWIFIGYSLPPADYEFKQLLKRVQLSRRKPPATVLIVGGSGASSTQKNYQKFFGPQLGPASKSYFQNGLSSDAIDYLKKIGALRNSCSR